MNNFSDIKNVSFSSKKGCICLVVLGGLGDAILFSPTFKAARSAYPEYFLVLIAANRFVEEVYLDDLIFDKIFVIESNKKNLKLLSQLLEIKKFFSYYGGVKLLVGAPRLSRFWIMFFKFLFNPTKIICFTNPPKFRNDIDISIMTAQILTKEIAHTPCVPIKENDVNLIRKFLLDNFGITSDKFIIAVYPSTERWNRPQVPLKVLLEAVLKVSKSIKNSKIIIIGADREKELFDNINVDYPDVISLAGVLNLRQTAALLSIAGLAVCNDGSLMHMAGALDRPLLAIMPNTSTIHTPPGTRKVMLSGDGLKCFPCYPSRPSWCIKSTFLPLCVKGITSDKIVDGIRKLLI